MPTLTDLIIVATDTDLVAELQEPTLGYLLTQLRADLDDTLVGSNVDGYFARSDLVGWINRAKADTEMRTRCHKVRLPITPVADTHTYSAQPLFEVFEVDFNGADLNYVDMANAAVGASGWDYVAAGMPTDWVPITGSSFRVKPTPAAAQVGMIDVLDTTPATPGTGYEVGDVITLAGNVTGTGATALVVSVNGTGGVTELTMVLPGQDFVAGHNLSATGGHGAGCFTTVTSIENLVAHGYSTSDALVLDTDIVTSIPAGLSVPSILSRAKALALAARPRLPGAAALAQAFNEEWGGSARDDKGRPVLTGWCAEIARSVQGGKRA